MKIIDVLEVVGVIVIVISVLYYFEKRNGAQFNQEIEHVKTLKDEFVKQDSVRRIKDRDYVDSLINMNNQILIQIKSLQNANNKGQQIDKKLIHLYDSLPTRFPKL